MTQIIHHQSKVSVVILAAGVGSRMRAEYPDIPKPLIPVAGRAMISRLVTSVLKSGIAREITIVIRPESRALFRKELGHHQIKYALQKKPLGTANAVDSARRLSKAGRVLVLTADQPFITSKTLRRLVKKHQTANPAMTILTARLPDFRGRRVAFRDWGRIIRKPAGGVAKIVESKNANIKERLTREVNPSVYCFDRRFLWKELRSLSAQNKQGEFLLTDMVEVARSRAKKVCTVQLTDPLEALGANTPKELRILESVAKKVDVATSRVA